MGIEKIGQLAQWPQGELARRMGQSGEHLWFLANGLDDRPVSPEEGFKSIGHEYTFERDTSSAELIHNTLLELTEKVAQRLRANGVRARTVAVKFREADFTTCTRRTTLNEPADTSERIFPVVDKLLRPLLKKKVAVRLIGVYAFNFAASDAMGQMRLFLPEPQKDRKIAAALDNIQRRYGNRAIVRAALVPPKKPESKI